MGPGGQFGYFFTVFVLFTLFLHVSPFAIMSIDLGGYYVKNAVVKQGALPHTVFDEIGRKFPLAVAFKEDDRKFGFNALANSEKYPTDSYLFFLRIIGQNIENPVVKEFLKNFPFYNIDKKNPRKTVVFIDSRGRRHSVEELLAMVFHYSKLRCLSFSGHDIVRAAVSIPYFFTQAQRRSILDAASVSHVPVNLLIGSNAAAVYNFGLFNMESFTYKGTYTMFIDVGAMSTEFSIFKLQMINVTSAGGTVEHVPHIFTKGLSHAESLGGLAFIHELVSLMMDSYDAKNKHNHISFPRDDMRAYTKLLLHAENALKQLTASENVTFTVESLIDNADVEFSISYKKQFEKRVEHLVKGFEKPFKLALDSANITLTQLSHVIVVGGATRIRCVENELLRLLQGKVLERKVNADEAAALGSAYYAASTSNLFLLRKLILKDIIPFSVEVYFPPPSGETSTQEILHKELFPRNSVYPNKKVMTFMKHLDDFTLVLSVMDNDSKTDIMSVSISDVRKVYDKYQAKGKFKSLKVHFKIDDNQILTTSEVEIIFEVNETVSSPPPLSLSDIGKKLSNLFGRGSPQNATTTNSTNSSQVNSTEQVTNSSTSESKSTNTTTSTTKVQVISIQLPFSIQYLDIIPMSEEERKNSTAKLDNFYKKEKRENERNAAFNDVESFLYTWRSKLENSDFVKFLKPEELKAIDKKVTSELEWIDIYGSDADVEVFRKKLKELYNITKEARFKEKEYLERPERLSQLDEMLNHTKVFVSTLSNYTGAKNKPLTSKDVSVLKKIYSDTKKWRDDVLKEQNALALNENPVLLLRDIEAKMEILRNSVTSLIQKINSFVPPKKPEETTKTAASNISENVTADNQTKIRNLTESTTPLTLKIGETTQTTLPVNKSSDNLSHVEL